MCGIFGIIKKYNSKVDVKEVKNNIDILFQLSESRGKDASGLAAVSDNKIKVLKDSVSASEFIKTSKYNKFCSDLNGISTVIGHARMETDGSYTDSCNNQPIVKDGCVTVHNGIIVNHKSIWKKYSKLKKKFEVDSEIINSLLRSRSESTGDKIDAVRKTLRELEGSYSIGVLFDDIDSLLLATNTGSLYLLEDDSIGMNLFVSERFFADQFNLKTGKSYIIKKIESQNGVFINLRDLEKCYFKINTKNNIGFRSRVKNRKIEILKSVNKSNRKFEEIKEKNIRNKKLIEEIIKTEFNRNEKKIKKLRRCRKCILPETMPFIKFDKNGVCNYCHNYQKMEVRGKRSLLKEIKKYDLDPKKNNCIVAFSGGRDSSYALHYVKKELGLNPVPFSYDWGMLTDLGRRNQARMTGKLGVEHILISADIGKKRDNIRKNIQAWLKKPHIGMIPLFMAGDKQYFYYLNKIKKDMSIDLVIYASNALEKSDFKYGFSNIKTFNKKFEGYKQIKKTKAIKLLFFYIKQYITNPSYINSSLMDTFGAFVSSFFVNKDHLYLFKYIKWDEKLIENTLIKKYNWELAPDTKTSWRIGDGTAALYNYIYYTITGFTENDTFKSNQIREGQISRKEGLVSTNKENEPRLESLIWYANTIGIDLEEAIKRVNQVKKIY